MPRMARLRGPEYTYHIMVRSISEVYLFEDDADKDRYLKTVKKYQDLFLFKVYAYCIMGSHAHFVIYSNGADISKIMHGINQSYAQYYNLKYGRHGHLFQDRFKSKLIEDENYLMSVSGYIHNNPNHMSKYEGCVENYPYSSLGIYLGMRKDKWEMVDTSLILLSSCRNIKHARKQYLEFVKKCDDIDNLPEFEFKNEETEYRSKKSIIIREYSTDRIAKYISGRLGFDAIALSSKHCRKVTAARSLYAALLRCLCDYKCCDLCKVMGNITQAGVSRLCAIGVKLIQEDEKYRNIVYDFIENLESA